MSLTPCKKAVVTGATGGIGSVVVATLLQQNYHVIALGRDKTRLDALDARLGMPSALQRYCLPLDIPQDSLTIHELLMTDAPYDLLVTAHCPSPSSPIPSAGLTQKHWHGSMTMEVYNTFMVFQAMLTLFVPQQASAVFLSSFHAFGTYPQRTIYATMKAAVCGMARALAVEYAPQGIRVNTIAPGQVEGARTDWFLSQQHLGARDRMLARSPSGQIVQPEDIASTVLWLANTPSMTGQTIIMDHGWSVDFSYDKTMAG